MVVSVPSRNITMVAWVSQVPALAEWVIDVRCKAQEFRRTLKLAPDALDLYGMRHTHASILGLEVLQCGDVLCDLNYVQNDSRLQLVNPSLLLSLLQGAASPDGQLFTIRFGGYARAECTCQGAQLDPWECETGGPSAGFHSCRRSPYEGSLYAFRDGPIMMSGWPVADSDSASFPHSLYQLRLRSERAGYREKFHSEGKPWQRDDDFYIRLGTLRGCSEQQKDALVAAMRKWLSNADPVCVPIHLEDLSIVYYADTALCTALDEIPVPEAVANPRLLRDLYLRWAAER